MNRNRYSLWPFTKLNHFFYSSLTPEVSKPSNWYLPIPYTYDVPQPQLVYGFPNVAPSTSPSYSASNEISNVLPLDPPFLSAQNSNSNPSTEITLPQQPELSSSSSSSDIEILSPSSEIPVVLHQQINI